MNGSTDVKIWACVSGGFCVGGIIAAALPYVQLIALLISIAAGLKALAKK